MRSRSDEVAAYFAEHAPRLERLVRARVTAPAETIEDACSYAWCQLVRRVDVALDEERAAGSDGPVGHTDDAVDALPEDDALAG